MNAVSPSAKLRVITTETGDYHRNDSYFYNYDCFQGFAAVQY